MSNLPPIIKAAATPPPVAVAATEQTLQKYLTRCKVRQILRVLERVGLRQNASAEMAEQIDLPKPESLSDSFGGLHQLLNGVFSGILQLEPL